MKDCMFQYEANYNVFIDTDLITREEADKLFDDNTERFKEDKAFGLNPEMAVWINCETSSSYGETSRHWCADDLALIGGELWERVSK